MEDRLDVLAEIAIGLAGFSSVVVAFRRRGDAGGWTRGDALRFQVMLQGALAAALFAILPAAAMGLGISARVLWPSLSGLLLTLMIGVTVLTARKILTMHFGSLSPMIAYFMFFSGGIVIIVQLLGITGWLVPRGPGPYVFGVTCLTIYSGIMFYRLLTAPVGDPVGHSSSTTDLP